MASPENLFLAWDKFKRGKRGRNDVARFEWQLEKNIFQLHRDLEHGHYRHGGYKSFHVNDPKQRLIHKASVRDRIVHHAAVNALNPIFEPAFIADSFSCRAGKGIHRAVDAISRSLNRVSGNNRKPCFALKCDIEKFFAMVDHKILLNIIRRRLKDEDALSVLQEIISSFAPKNAATAKGRGLPLGNLTSQLFANVYLNEFDQFVKQELQIKNYFRYTDDFVIIAATEDCLARLINPIRQFLCDKLRLKLHPGKIIIRKFAQGVDFLGYIVLPQYRLVRAKTRRRILRKFGQKIKEYNTGLTSREKLEQSLMSFLGVFKHANGHKASQQLKNQFWHHLNR